MSVKGKRERFGWENVITPSLPNAVNSIAHPGKDKNKKCIEYCVRE